MYTKYKTVKISDLRKHTAEVVDEIEKLGCPVSVFSRSQPKVMMMSCNWFKEIEPHINKPNKGKNGKKKIKEKHGIDFFIDPPEEFLIKKKGLDAVKLIRAERG